MISIEGERKRKIKSWLKSEQLKKKKNAVLFRKWRNEMEQWKLLAQSKLNLQKSSSTTHSSGLSVALQQAHQPLQKIIAK